MVQILMPDGVTKMANGSQTVQEVINACLGTAAVDDAAAQNYALVFFGRKLGADQKLADVPHFNDARPIRLVRRQKNNTPSDPPNSTQMSRVEVDKLIGQCQQMHANLGEELQQKLETYMIDDGEKRFRQAVVDHPRLFHEPIALSAVKDMRLLVPFVLEQFPYAYPHCVLVLKKALQDVVAANRLMPSSSAGANNQNRNLLTAGGAGGSRQGQAATAGAGGPMITAQMLNQALAVAMGGTAPAQPAAATQPPPPPVVVPPANPYAAQLAQLAEWGFTDAAENVQALMLADGSVEQALQILIAMREQDN